jgi:hypothetical protein
MALSKREVLAATMLAIIAITAIAYAQLAMGTITVKTEERVSVSGINIGTVPARAAGSKTENNAITVDLRDLSGTALIGVELVANDIDIYKGFRAFVVQIKNTNMTSPVVLTLSNPYAEFEILCGALQNFDVTVIYVAGEKTVDVEVRLGVTIKAIYTS